MIDADVLAQEYVGRCCPEILDTALGFHDGICQARRHDHGSQPRAPLPTTPPNT